MKGTGDIKYTYDYHEKSNTCIENLYRGLLVHVMIFICIKSKQLVQLVKEMSFPKKMCIC